MPGCGNYRSVKHSEAVAGAQLRGSEQQDGFVLRRSTADVTLRSTVLESRPHRLVSKEARVTVQIQMRGYIIFLVLSQV